MTGSAESRALIDAMFSAALAAVEPSRVVADALRTMETDLDLVQGAVTVVSIGKAAEAMARGAVDALGDQIASGFVLTKDDHATGQLDDRFSVFEAAHPVPDQRGVDATLRIVEAVRQLTADNVLIALISGGGSALFEAPRPPLGLSDIAEVTRLMLQAGAPIQDLNAVRIPLSLVKGGGLRRETGAGTVITLLLSDVLSNDPHLIASGPTVPVQRDAAAALDLLRRYGVDGQAPPPVLDVLTSSNHDDSPNTEWDVLQIVGDNSTAVDASRVAAERQGRHVSVIWKAVEGEAEELGRDWIAAIAAMPEADVLLGGGEATVTVLGDGNGGRNTEFALAAAKELARLGLENWVVASLATDGQDALTGAAGAVVDASVVDRATSLGLDPAQALAENDSATLLDRTGNLVRTGPTGTNVNDIYFAIRAMGKPA